MNERVCDPCAEASISPGKFNDYDVTKWMLQAARGLNYLHTRSPPIVHRDLKLANLMLDKNWDVRLIDFGLAKILGFKEEEHFFGGMVSPVNVTSATDERQQQRERHDASSPELSSYEHLPSPSPLYEMTGGTGSFKYMAPEVFLGLMANDRLDVYSLSIIAYELLTRLIFLAGMMTRDHGQGVARQISGVEWARDVALKGVRPDLSVLPASSGWRTLLPQMWVRDPTARISARALVALISQMHDEDEYKCTDPRKHATSMCCVVM